MSAEHQNRQPASESQTPMPENPGWQSEVTQTEWSVIRLVLSLGLPALATYARRWYLNMRKRRHQHEAMLEGWQKVQEEIAPTAEDRDNLRVLAEKAISEVRDTRHKIVSQENEIAVIVSRIDTMEAVSEARHLELMHHLDAIKAPPK